MRLALNYSVKIKSINWTGSLFIGLIFFGSSTSAQNPNPLSELFKLIVADEHMSHIIDYEADAPRYLSVFLSKDTLIVFRNDFSFIKYKSELKPQLLELQKNCSERDVLSIIACNYYRIPNSILYTHNLSVFDNLPANYAYLNVKFHNINKSFEQPIYCGPGIYKPTVVHPKEK